MLGAWVERAFLAAAVASPLLGLAVARTPLSRRGATAAAWASAAAAGALVMVVAVRGPVQLGLGGTGTRPWVGLTASPLTAVLLLLVCGVGALVQSFAGRFLDAGRAAERFAVRGLAVVLAMALVAASSTLAGLVVGWVAAGASFVALAADRRDLPGTGAFAAAAAPALAVGDGCLVVAAALVWCRNGNAPLGAALAPVAANLGDLRAVVALLVVIAALARCAQGWFRRWLTLTVAAPTPACALLHAGVVNGGAILLVRLGAVAAWPPAMVVLFVVSAATAVWAGGVMANQADVKGRLASSTASQMGFMLAECAVGAWPAAMVHLLGHGCYKASQFFSSGSAVPVAGAGRPLPPRRTRARLAAAGLTGAAATAAAAAGLLAGDGWVLTTYAGLSALALAEGWWARRPPGGAAGTWWPALLVAAAGAYGLLVAAIGRFLLPALPTAPGLGGAWLLAPAAGTALGAQLLRAGRLGLALRLRLAHDGAPRPGWDGRPGRRVLSSPARPRAAVRLAGGGREAA